MIFQGRSISYAKLLKKIDELYDTMRAHNLPPGTLVGLDLERSDTLIAAIFAVLRCRCAFVILDQQDSQQQKEDKIRRSNPIYLYRNGSLIQNTSFQCTVMSHTIAYIMFTSGSLGNPKGICISIQSLFNAVNTLTSAINLTINDCILAMSSVSFDIFLLETIVSLCNGIRVVLADQQACQSPRMLFDLMEAHNVTVAQMVPSRLSILLTLDPDCKRIGRLRILMLGGESLHQETLRLIQEHTETHLYHLYGLTEDTIWSSAHRIECCDQLYVDAPIPGHGIYLLNADIQEAKTGEIGQIYLTGVGLAHSFLNKETHFTTIIRQGRRLKALATGDQGEKRGDRIVFTGRLINTVKYRGHLINLIEIEAIANRYPHVTASVSLFLTNHNNKPLLCVYYQASSPISEQEIKRYMEKQLPAMLHPCYCFQLQNLPCLSNGKIDRNSLVFKELMRNRRQINYG